MKKGFTLIETMVVIIIIGIIIIIAVPNFASMQAKARIRAGANEIAQDLRHIRERALSLGRAFTIDSPDIHTYRITNPDGETSVYVLGGSTGGTLRFGIGSNYAGGLPQEANGPIPAGGFDFLPNGILVLDGRGGTNKGVIYLTDGKNNFAVGINPLGKVRMYVYRNSNWE